MLNVPANVRLEQNRLNLSGDATAIDELFRNVSNFGYMRMGRDVIAIRENKTREAFRMLFENGEEIREFHLASIFPFRNIIKPLFARSRADNLNEPASARDLLTAAPPDGPTPREMIRLPNPEGCVEQSYRSREAPPHRRVWKPGACRHPIQAPICPRRSPFTGRRRVSLCPFHFRPSSPSLAIS
jgi:hypothetical protein